MCDWYHGRDMVLFVHDRCGGGGMEDAIGIWMHIGVSRGDGFTELGQFIFGSGVGNVGEAFAKLCLQMMMVGFMVIQNVALL